MGSVAVAGFREGWQRSGHPLSPLITALSTCCYTRIYLASLPLVSRHHTSAEFKPTSPAATRAVRHVSPLITHWPPPRPNTNVRSHRPPCWDACE
jgi:hypothetical protein